MSFQATCTNTACKNHGKPWTVAQSLAKRRLRCKLCHTPFKTAQAHRHSAFLWAVPIVAMLALFTVGGGVSVLGYCVSARSEKLSRHAAQKAEAAVEPGAASRTPERKEQQVPVASDHRASYSPSTPKPSEQPRTNPVVGEAEVKKPVVPQPGPSSADNYQTSDTSHASPLETLGDAGGKKPGPVPKPGPSAADKYALPLEALGDPAAVARIKVVQVECTAFMGKSTNEVVFTWHSPSKCRYSERPTAPMAPPKGPPGKVPPPKGFPDKKQPPGFPGKAPPGPGAPAELIFICNGEKGYFKAPFPPAPAKVLTGAELQAHKTHSAALGLSNLHSLKDHQVQLVEEVQLKGAPHLKVRVSKGNEPPYLLYFDKATSCSGSPK